MLLPLYYHITQHTDSSRRTQQKSENVFVLPESTSSIIS